MLETGDYLPAIAARNLDGDQVDVTELVQGSWATVLFYRGNW